MERTDAGVIVDSSAMIAILLEEPEAAGFVDCLTRAASARMSAANLAEMLLVLGGRKKEDPRALVEDLVNRAGIIIESVTAAQAWRAGAAFRRFGKGRHPAALNFGDCFAYALAKTRNLPLLFKGDDFVHTDIEPALKPA